MIANSLHAEKEVLQKQLQSPSYTYDPQIQELPLLPEQLAGLIID